jgi:hypothetical protein
LRNAGTAVVERVPLFRLSHPGFEVVNHEYLQDGVACLRRGCAPRAAACTPPTAGKAGGTSWWQLDHHVKQSSDYGLLERYLEARTYHPTTRPLPGPPVPMAKQLRGGQHRVQP